MGIEKLVAKQYRDKVNNAVNRLDSIKVTMPEGWIRTVRKALGMTGAQLAQKLGVSKSRITRVEQDELSGSVTIKTMQAIAETMDSKFVYAIVPNRKVEDIIKQRAFLKARHEVKVASTHMALEAQTLTDEELEYEIERIALEYIEKMPLDFWSDE